MKKLLIITSFILLAAQSNQDPNRFRQEIENLITTNKSVSRDKLIVFTGSSSIKMWSSLKESFPKHNVVNMGFGGSDMSELLYFTDEIITPFSPKQVFIYEGDNDIAKGKKTDEILSSADGVVKKIRQKLPDVPLVFISAKPSVRRWELRDEYVAYNKALEAWTKNQKNVGYADVWSPMLKKDGMVREDLFIEDKLHMNEKGYEIWQKVLKKFLI